MLTITKANRENPRYIWLKRAHNLERLYESGLVTKLSSLFNTPQAIIVFGSYARGEDTEKSDVDIAIIASMKTEADISLYEKKLSRAISLHVVDLSKVSKEFKSSLYNGILLEGSW